MQMEMVTFRCTHYIHRLWIDKLPVIDFQCWIFIFTESWLKSAAKRTKKYYKIGKQIVSIHRESRRRTLKTFKHAQQANKYVRVYIYNIYIVIIILLVFQEHGTLDIQTPGFLCLSLCAAISLATKHSHAIFSHDQFMHGSHRRSMPSAHWATCKHFRLSLWCFLCWTTYEWKREYHDIHTNIYIYINMFLFILSMIFNRIG